MEGEILHAFVITRHGIRAPLHALPKSPWKPDDWPTGLKNLTNAGKMQLFQLGQKLRHRYDSLLTGSPREIFAKTTGNVRCYESASCLVAGLCPPVGDWRWSDLNWQPVQIHTDEIDYSEITMECLMKDIASLLDERGFGAFQTLRSLIDFVNRQIGKDNEKPSLDFLLTVDCITTLSDNGKLLPTWFVEVQEECRKAIGLLFPFMFSGYEKQYAVPTLKEVLHVLKSGCLDKSKNQYKMHFYCQSDANIYSILKQLNKEFSERPGVGSTILLEIIRRDSEHFVSLLYLKDPLKEPCRLRIADFGLLCPVEKFTSFLETCIEGM